MLIKTAEFVISSARADRCPPTDGKPEYAFIGRSKSGKFAHQYAHRSQEVGDDFGHAR